MTLPQPLARFAKHVVNPVLGRVSGHIPPLATLHHVGRRSGTQYRTPVMAFPRDGRWVFALTYGPQVQWLRNVEAAGQFELEYGGRTVLLTDLRRVHGPAGDLALPLVVRSILNATGVHDFLLASSAPLTPRRA